MKFSDRKNVTNALNVHRQKHIDLEEALRVAQMNRSGEYTISRIRGKLRRNGLWGVLLRLKLYYNTLDVHIIAPSEGSGILVKGRKVEDDVLRKIIRSFRTSSSQIEHYKKENNEQLRK